MIDPSVLVDEFASTFREWHYLTVGLSVGALAGWIARSYVDEYTRL